MQKVNERETAVYALMDITCQGGYNNIVLKKSLKRINGVDKRQKAFVTELVNGTLRNIMLIDYLIGRFSKTPVKKLKPFILNILRITIYQIKFMDRVPYQAAIHEAVALTKKKGYQNLSGYVNGVLRTAQREMDTVPYPDLLEDPLNHIAILYSYPQWLITYWLTFMDISEIQKMCQKNNTPPVVTACVNTLKISRGELMDLLEKESMTVTEGFFNENAIRITKNADIGNAPSFLQGYYHIMDESSMLSVALSGVKPGDRVLDLCAAPGGKSFFSAYKMGNNGKILSCDIHEHKLELIKRTANRLDIHIIKPFNHDMTQYEASLSLFDVVFVDAPCSGLGLIRKKPDIKYTKSMEDIKALSQIQQKLLQAGAAYVAPGGVLVYSTCTVSKIENEDNITWFLNNYPFEMDDCLKNAPSKAVDVMMKEQKGPGILLTPHQHDTDGFYIAVMRRRG